MPAITVEPERDNRWLLLTLQLPAHPSNARVKAWRRLQQLGAIAIKNAVYVLPNSAQALEDFTWLRTEIEGAGGQATIFSASTVESADELDIARQFNTARSTDFEQLRREIRDAAKTKSGAALKDVRALRERFEQIKTIDFFAAPGGSETNVALAALEQATRREAPIVRPAASAALDPQVYQRRTWVTRPRPGVDRFASAWLIQRFIDPQATFTFSADRPDPVADNVVPFDMYDVGFRHEGQRCTFEVLVLRFGIDDPRVRRISEIVHDLDLKDDRYRPAEASTVAMLIAGLQTSIADDQPLLQQGIALFETLYAGLGPPPTAARRKTSRART